MFQSSNLRIVFVRAYLVIDVTSLHQLRATYMTDTVALLAQASQAQSITVLDMHPPLFTFKHDHEIPNYENKLITFLDRERELGIRTVHSCP